MFDTAANRKLKLSDSLYSQMLAFTKDVSTTTATGSPVSGEMGGELNFLIGKLIGKFKIEDQTRKEVSEKVSPLLSTLLDVVDQVAKSIEAETGKKVIAIVEDLDKLDPATANQLFYEHGASLSAPRLSIIYTFPIALRHDNNFAQVRMSFPQTYVLPILKTRTRQDIANEEGLLKCEEILTRRCQSALFSMGATRALAQACGGVPRLLISLASQACLEAMVDDKSSIDLASVDAAIKASRREYEILLSQYQLGTLRRVRRTKAIDNDEEYRELLHNLSCLEYWNDDVWYDVHPVIEPLLVT